MKIESDLMMAVRSGCALGRMAESEVEAIVDHLEKLGWTPPAKPVAKPALVVPVAPAPATPVAPAPAPVAPPAPLVPTPAPLAPAAK